MTSRLSDHRSVFRLMLWAVITITCWLASAAQADEIIEQVEEEQSEIDYGAGTEEANEVEDETETETETPSDTTDDTGEVDERDTAKTYGHSVELRANEYHHSQPMYQYPQPQYHHPEPMYHPEPMPYSKPKKEKKKKEKKKKVYVPVFVPEKEKKKMKIISVDKGFFTQGGTQLFGKFKSLKHCMKACAVTPACLAGDYNPWLHKCYQHSNYTACNTLGAHPQYVHFSKVPCTVVDAPSGRVTLGASMANGIEQKGIDSLQQCIKKCAIAGGGVQPTATVPESFNRQACFAIDYDFATHKCFFFGSNILVSLSPLPIVFYLHCPVQANVLPSSLGSRPNPSVVHITFCPLPTGFRG